MIVLQDLYSSWVANGIFGPLTQVYKTEDYTAKEGERVTTTGSPTITVPDVYTDNDVLDTPRTPYDLSVVQVADTVADTVNTYIYDRTQWVDIEGLVKTDNAPLEGFGVGGLGACLAFELGEFFGSSASPGLIRARNRFIGALRTTSGRACHVEPTENTDYA